MHTTIVHPDGTVTVTVVDEDNEDNEVEVAAPLTYPVLDALDVLDEHFDDSVARHMLDYLRGRYNEELWAATGNQGCVMTCNQPCNQSGMYGDPPSLNLGEGAMLRG